MAVGTNNSRQLTQANGSAFAQTAKSVDSWAATYGGGHELVWGANDIESFCPDDCQPSSDTYSWYTGYSNASGPGYVDFGSADGCPPSGTCSGDWNQGDYYNFSWYLPLAHDVPEIFVYPQAQQWEDISSFGSFQPTGPIAPFAPLDNNALDPNSYTPAQAWSEMNPYFPYMAYSMEMHDG